jgi:hypothetical protein
MSKIELLVLVAMGTLHAAYNLALVTGGTTVDAGLAVKIADASPQPRARITGAIYLLYFLTAILAQFLASRKLVISGIVVNLIAFAFYIALTLFLYYLFKPVSRNLSWLAALFSLAGCAIGVLGLFHLSHLSPLWFFGPYCLLIGCLILWSTFLPRVLGALMALAGIAWLAYLSPPIEKHFSIYIEAIGILAEASLMLWLIVMGVNVPRWNEQANPANNAQLQSTE